MFTYVPDVRFRESGEIIGSIAAYRALDRDIGKRKAGNAAAGFGSIWAVKASVMSHLGESGDRLRGRSGGIL